MSARKETISCRVLCDWIDDVDAIAQAMGCDRSAWLVNVIGEALGKQPLGSIKSLDTRMTVMEKRLSKIASLVTG